MEPWCGVGCGGSLDLGSGREEGAGGSAGGDGALHTYYGPMQCAHRANQRRGGGAGPHSHLSRTHDHRHYASLMSSGHAGLQATSGASPTRL